MQMPCCRALKIFVLLKLQYRRGRMELPPLKLGYPAVMDRRVCSLLSRLQVLSDIAEPSAKQVHQIRTHIKKLRSWLRLVKKKDNSDDLVSLDRLLHELADTYAGMRSAQVHLQTLLRLEAECNSSDLAAQCRALAASLPPVSRIISGKLDTNGILHHLQSAFPKVSGQPTYTILAALERSHKRARKLSRSKKIKQGNQEELHRLRKRVKNLDYQLLIAGSDSNKGVTLRRKQLRELSEALGVLHDLVEIRKFLKESSGHPGNRYPDVMALLKLQQQAHTGMALKTAAEVLDIKTSCFLQSASP